MKSLKEQFDDIDKSFEGLNKKDVETSIKKYLAEESFYLNSSVVEMRENHLGVAHVDLYRRTKYKAFVTSEILKRLK